MNGRRRAHSTLRAALLRSRPGSMPGSLSLRRLLRRFGLLDALEGEQDGGSCRVRKPLDHINRTQIFVAARLCLPGAKPFELHRVECLLRIVLLHKRDRLLSVAALHVHAAADGVTRLKGGDAIRGGRSYRQREVRRPRHEH